MFRALSAAPDVCYNPERMKEAYQESEAGCSLNTDEELYARFLCGEDDAIRQLMDRYLERLTLFCFTFLHSRLSRKFVKHLSYTCKNMARPL